MVNNELNFKFIKFLSSKESVTMKSKRLFQIFVVLVLLFSSVGSVQANSETALEPLDAIVIPRDLSYWNATYIGFVSDSIYEKWAFVFNESHNFVITVTPITGDLVPLLILQDGAGNEITRGTGSLTSTQSAGNYSIQVQPQTGSGFYILTLREVVQVQPSVSTVVNPGTVNVGETATVTVSLNNVPPEGYTSAEFTCTYDASIVAVSNIVVTNLFGADAAVAINGPQGGSFIIAIAGSNGNKATSSGPAFTLSVTGLQAGQTAIGCTARVSKGDNVLTSLPSSGTSLTVVGSAPTLTSTPTPADTPTSTSETPGGSPTPTSSTPIETATPTSEPPVGSVTPTSETPAGTATQPPPSETPAGTITPTSETPVETATPTSETPVGSPTATATPLPNGTLTGTVLAGKPVTVSLYSGTTLVTSVTADGEGDFSLTAPAGTYTVIATASGFLSAQGSAVITAGGSSTKPTITLPAGDIDGNNVIDQFDALTIGMNYNSASPSAADLNDDGVINVLDLELLADNYRETGPLVWETSYP